MKRPTKREQASGFRAASVETRKRSKLAGATRRDVEAGLPPLLCPPLARRMPRAQAAVRSAARLTEGVRPTDSAVLAAWAPYSPMRRV